MGLHFVKMKILHLAKHSRIIILTLTFGRVGDGVSEAAFAVRKNKTKQTKKKKKKKEKKKKKTEAKNNKN